MISSKASISIKKTAHSRMSETDFDNLKFGQTCSDHMFVADYKDGQWQNWRIEPYEHLRVSPACSTIHYGQSVFEGLKGYKDPETGKVFLFRPQANSKRLNKSAERMCIPPVPEEMFMEAVKTLVEVDKEWAPEGGGRSLYIRPFIFATDEFIGIRPSDTYKFIVFTCPVGTYYSKPVRVKIETDFSRACSGGTGAAKAAGNYAGSLYPALLAQKEGFDQLLWTDAKEHKYIEESGTMNVMFVIGDKLITAPAGNTVLSGITRDSVLTLAREWGMSVEERSLSVDEFEAAAKSGELKEVFGTGTAVTIQHIQSVTVNGQEYELPLTKNRVFSNKVYQALEDIKYKRTPDTRGWIFEV